MSRPIRGAAAAQRAAIASKPALGPATSRAAETPAGGVRLDELYREHFAWLVRALRRRFGWQLAEDLAQQTFLRLRGYEGADIRRPRALLLTVARSALIEQRRRAQVRAPDVFAAAELHDRTGSFAGEQDAQLLLKQIIMSLPPKLRDVFVLSRFAGMTYPQIADHLNISQKTVEARMTKALAFCMAQLRA